MFVKLSVFVFGLIRFVSVCWACRRPVVVFRIMFEEQRNIVVVWHDALFCHVGANSVVLGLFENYIFFGIVESLPRISPVIILVVLRFICVSLEDLCKL